MKRALLILAAVLLRAESPEAQRWWSRVVYLADDKLEGRETGSAGHRTAARYVAQEFERAGLRPAGTDGYRQPVTLRSQKIDESGSSLALLWEGREEPLILGDDAYFSLRAKLAAEIEAPLIFAGYGFAVPERDYDELAGLKLKGKVVLYLSGGPRNLPAPLMAHYQSSEERWKRLQAAGAAGIGVISNPKTSDIPWQRSRLARFQSQMRLAGFTSGGPRLSFAINPSRAGRFFSGTGHTMEELLALAERGQPLPKFELRARIRARTKVDVSEVVSENVLGVLEGSHPAGKNQYIVLTAHLDHVGVGQPISGDSIYNGAMDNASGIATLLEMAGLLKDRQLGRSVLFAAVTGEEKGLLGSQYFARFPTVPRAAIAANLNFDMFLPLYPLKRLTVIGIDESTLGDTARTVAEQFGLTAHPDLAIERNSFIRSDQYSFVRQGIPSLAFKIGYTAGSAEEQIFKAWLKERYHAPSDDILQPVDKEAAAEFSKLMAAVVEAVANDPRRPQWKEKSFFRRFAQ
ncbi:MAG: M28 family peptidase [Acidobacteria bacterium]|nr:M28 family peptidase [Acidobacteriota bacterium]